MKRIAVLVMVLAVAAFCFAGTVYAADDMKDMQGTAMSGDAALF